MNYFKIPNIKIDNNTIKLNSNNQLYCTSVSDGTAYSITYIPVKSGLVSTNVQNAIDELVDLLLSIENELDNINGEVIT